VTRREPFNALGKSGHQRRVVKKQPGKAVASMGVRARLIPLDLKRARNRNPKRFACDIAGRLEASVSEDYQPPRCRKTQAA